MLPKVWLKCILLAIVCCSMSITAMAQTKKVSLNLKNVKRAAAVQALRIFYKQSSSSDLFLGSS
jgi:hypothetical protein